jgi:hypothetical protein
VGPLLVRLRDTIEIDEHSVIVTPPVGVFRTLFQNVKLNARSTAANDLGTSLWFLVETFYMSFLPVAP